MAQDYLVEMPFFGCQIDVTNDVNIGWNNGLVPSCICSTMDVWISSVLSNAIILHTNAGVLHWIKKIDKWYKKKYIEAADILFQVHNALFGEIKTFFVVETSNKLMNAYRCLYLPYIFTCLIEAYSINSQSSHFPSMMLWKAVLLCYINIIGLGKFVYVIFLFYI